MTRPLVLVLVITTGPGTLSGCGSSDQPNAGEADGTSSDGMQMDDEGRPNGDGGASGTSSSGSTTSASESGGSSSSSSSATSSSGTDASTDEGSSTTATGDDGPMPDMLDPDAPWYALGTGEFDYTPLQSGDTVDLVLGPQGAWMFPMPLRGGNFTIPDDPLDWQHPDAPKLSMVFDIADFETSFGDYFYELNDYAVPLTVLESGEYEFIYVPVIAPDDFFTICDIHGHAASMTSTLVIADQADPLSFDLELTINVPPPGGVPCDEP